MINLIPILTFGLNLIILIVSACCFIKIMKNDLTHVQKDLTEIKNNQIRDGERLDNICERVSKIEGKIGIGE